MNDEFERICKKAVVALSRNYPDICLKGLRKSTKKPVSIASVLAKIQTEHLLNMSLECYL
jgi:hypothetical protein